MTEVEKVVTEEEMEVNNEVTEKADDSDNSESEDYESDDSLMEEKELQAAFASGLLKPGLNVVAEVKKKAPIVDKKKMEEVLIELKVFLPWIERLDMINEPATLAPELAYQEEEHKKIRNRQKIQDKDKGDIENDVVHNDFKREMLFYRQAQSAVTEGIKRLHTMNIPTQRPEDYFAQMVKTDDHMNKIRKVLLDKQQGEERRQKIRKLRELKKYGKQVQMDTEQQKSKEKKLLSENVKKFRDGKLKNLDFLNADADLDELDETESNQKGRRGKPGSKQRREFRNDKYGFGGRKKGTKKNTSDSLNDFNVSDINARGSKKSKGKMISKHGAAKRLGKERRAKGKGGGKRK